MKKGTEYIGTVTRTDFPNKGRVAVTSEDGTTTTVTVKDAVEGQTVRLMITKARSGNPEGRLLSVVAPAPVELPEKDCNYFGLCGGCSLRMLPYEAQLALKEKQVRTLLTNAIGDACPEFIFEGIKSSPMQTAYRNKMEYSFGDAYKDGPLALGLHKKGSFYDILTTDTCKIVHEDFCKILTATLAYFKEQGISYFHKQSHLGVLRHLLVRRAVKTGEILVDLVTTSQGFHEAPARVATAACSNEGSNHTTETSVFENKIHPLWEGFANTLLALPLTGNLTGILHTVNDSPADTIQSDHTEILYGQDYFYEELLGLKFRISPFSFFQTNSLGAEVLYNTVREYIGNVDGRLVFDLYSGTGTIAQLLAPVAKKVIGVEIVEEAVLAARENAALNGLHNCEFIAGDVLKVIDTIEEKPELIILDPPRDGIHPKALPKILTYGVPHIVYVSCKPTSLARDLEVFLANGYHVVRGCAVDMFPGTNHVETVVLLSREKVEHQMKPHSGP